MKRRRIDKANDVIIYVVMVEIEGGQMIKLYFFLRYSFLNFVVCTFLDNEDILKFKW